VIPEQRFLIQSFADEAIVYDQLSGDTHYLNATAHARLQGWSQEEIAIRLDIEKNSQELADTIKAMDEQFRAWGLVV
jgi:hypothetical protein